MPRYTLTGELPAHKYVWVDSRLTHREPCGFIPAVWYGLVSYPARAWGCTVMLESGAIYRNLPPHAIAFNPKPVKWRIQQAQTWDCYGWDWTAVQYAYLTGLECKAKCAGRDFHGEYLFSVAPVGDAFSAAPDQSKEFTFIALDNGRLTIQPTNHVVFQERSFTTHTWEWPTGLKRQTDIYASE